MKSDESFERDVRASLLASTDEHAPDDLVARIGEIPARQPSPSAGRGGLHLAARALVNLAAAAVVVVAIAALIVTRNGNLPPGGQPSGSGSLPTASAATATPAASASPSVASPAPSATPIGPSAVPASTLGLSPVSATFVSATDGWVLGKGTCSSGSCAAIMRTADAGRTWTPIPAPAASIVPGGGQGAPGISRLRFADARNGWAYGPDLWATHDGGVTWNRLTISGLPADAAVVALEAGNGSVHAVAFDGQGYRVATGPVGTDDFRLSALRVPVGAGPVPAVQLVLSGAAGWLLENDRTVVGGARLVNGTWVAWQPPCLNVVGPAYLAASSATELAAACDVGLWSSPTGSHLFISHDGGATFAEAATAVPLTMSGQITAASPSVIVVGGTDATGAVLVATFDAGRTWSVVGRLGTADPVDLGFTTPTQGVVVATSGDAPATFWMTRDGGRTWSAVGAAGS